MEEVTGFSIVDENNGLIANYDFTSGELICSGGYKVIEHTKEKPAFFQETDSTYEQD